MMGAKSSLNNLGSGEKIELAIQTEASSKLDQSMRSAEEGRSNNCSLFTFVGWP